MINDFLTAIIGNYLTSCFVIGIVVGGIQVWRLKRPRTAGAVSGLMLNNFILYAIGVAQVINFVMHSVFGEYAAQTIGWAQSPFQFELALSSLGFGVIAFIVHGAKNSLRSKAAIVIAAVIFGYGAAGGHIFQMVVNNDYSTNNGGLLLFSDIFINTVGLALLIWHAVARRNQLSAPTDAVVEPAFATRTS